MSFQTVKKKTKKHIGPDLFFSNTDSQTDNKENTDSNKMK